MNNRLKWIAIIVVLILGFIGILKLGTLKTNDDIKIDASGDTKEDVEDLQKDNETKFEDEEIEVEQVTGLLEIASSMYAKISIGEKKESVIQKLGEPSEIELYNSEYLKWKDDKQYLLEVVIKDGVVSEKQIILMSNKKYGILLGKELGTTIENLENIISNVQKGMTLEEVKAILGNATFEKMQTSINEITYIWYDQNEQQVNVGFKDNAVYYVGKVR